MIGLSAFPSNQGKAAGVPWSQWVSRKRVHSPRYTPRSLDPESRTNPAQRRMRWVKGAIPWVEKAFLEPNHGPVNPGCCYRSGWSYFPYDAVVVLVLEWEVHGRIYSNFQFPGSCIGGILRAGSALEQVPMQSRKSRKFPVAVPSKRELGKTSTCGLQSERAPLFNHAVRAHSTSHRPSRALHHRSRVNTTEGCRMCPVRSGLEYQYCT